MSTIYLQDDQWAKILAFLRADPRAYVGQAGACRRFVEGVHWIARSGGPMAAAPGPLRPLEQRLQAVCPLVRS